MGLSREQEPGPWPSRSMAAGRVQEAGVHADPVVLRPIRRMRSGPSSVSMSSRMNCADWKLARQRQPSLSQQVYVPGTDQVGDVGSVREVPEQAVELAPARIALLKVALQSHRADRNAEPHAGIPHSGAQYQAQLRMAARRPGRVSTEVMEHVVHPVDAQRAAGQTLGTCRLDFYTDLVTLGGGRWAGRHHCSDCPWAGLVLFL